MVMCLGKLGEELKVTVWAARRQVVVGRVSKPSADQLIPIVGLQRQRVVGGQYAEDEVGMFGVGAVKDSTHVLCHWIIAMVGVNVETIGCFEFGCDEALQLIDIVCVCFRELAYRCVMRDDTSKDEEGDAIVVCAAARAA